MNAPDTESGVYLYSEGRRQKAEGRWQQERRSEVVEKLHVRLGDSAGRRGQVNKEGFTACSPLLSILTGWGYQVLGFSAFSSFTTSANITTAVVGTQVATVRLPRQRNDMTSYAPSSTYGVRPCRTRQLKARKHPSYRLSGL